MAAGFGSVVAGWPCGILIEHVGWTAYFVVLAIVACMTMAFVYPYRNTATDTADAPAPTIAKRSRATPSKPNAD